MHDVDVLKAELRKLRSELNNKKIQLMEITEQYDNAVSEITATEKELKRRQSCMKETFLKLLDTYFDLKNNVIPLESKVRKDEYYLWMENAGLLE